jgi:Cu2+-exporting ATPase
MAEPVVCTHCGSPVPAALVEAGEAEQYCCNGCRAAAAFMRGCGLGDFHRLRAGAVGPPVAEVAPDTQAAAAFDAPAFRAEHVVQRRDGLHAITWSVVGMHCAACVWVLERLPALAEGVRAATVDLGRGTLLVVYDPRRSGPGAQAALAARLGYRLRPWVPATEVAERRHQARALLLRLAVATACAVGAMNLSMNLWAGELARDLDPGNRLAFGWTALAVALPACLWSAWPIHRAAWAALRAGRWSVDLAASATVALAVGATTWRLLAGGNENYADAAAMFIALLLGARWALHTAQERVRGLAGAFDGLLPLTARCRQDGQLVTVAAEALLIGDEVVVEAGERLPCDGDALGAGAVDEAVLTGETRPRRLGDGDGCHAGCTAVTALRLRATATGAATRVARLLASGRAAATVVHDDPADRLARWFMPALLLAALVTGLGWGLAAGLEAGLAQGLAVALAGCPCAIGLAVPLARAAWVARLARQGVLVREVQAVERLTELHAVVFDKTGTLTTGRMRVVRWRWLAPVDQAAVLAGVRGLAERSRHPASAAVAAWIATQGIAAVTVGTVGEEAGRGVACAGPLGRLQLGAPAWCGLDERDLGAASTVAVALDGRALALAEFEDPLHPAAAEAVAAAARLAEVHLWSGDRAAPVAAVATALGIPAGRAHGGCSPEDKAGRMAGLVTGGAVVMVGDGVNDAAALARADVAIALRGGLTAALDCCHVFVADPALGVRALPVLIAGAVRQRRIQRRLLAWAALYNLVAVGCAAAGLWGPLVCAVAMPLSSIATIAGAVVAGQGRR